LKTSVQNKRSISVFAIPSATENKQAITQKRDANTFNVTILARVYAVS
jgi:hypothetical protein